MLIVDRMTGLTRRIPKNKKRGNRQQPSLQNPNRPAGCDASDCRPFPDLGAAPGSDSRIPGRHLDPYVRNRTALQKEPRPGLKFPELPSKGALCDYQKSL